MSVTIRSSTPADIPVILQLVRELAEYERLSDEAVATEQQFHQALFGEQKYAEAVIAEIPAGIAGLALFFHNFSTFTGKRGLYLEDLYVRHEHRGQGIGLALLRHLARIAIERDCARFEWSVLDWNESAIGFYEKLGARPMSEWTVYRLQGEALHDLAK